MHVDAILEARAERTPAAQAFGAHALTRLLLQRALQASPEAAQLDRRLRAACSVRLLDMVDHVRHPAASCLTEDGWRTRAQARRALDPTLLGILEGDQLAIALRVDSVERFLSATGIEARIEGAAHGPYRQARIFQGRDASFWAIERHGWDSHVPPSLGERKLRRARLHQQIFRTRRRQFQSEQRALAHTLRLAEAAATDLGGAWAGALFLRAEREYWTTRCLPALRQHQRQLAAGVGWCTVRHHAFACSREHFSETMRVFETLGHADAGLTRPAEGANWGAQVLRPSTAGTAPPILLCLDLSERDWALGSSNAALSPLTWLGPPGLWCGLHGESLLEAGLRSVSAAYDLATLAPEAVLTDRCSGAKAQRRLILQGEHRAVDPRRAAARERARFISRTQSEDYSMTGADGAHFEAICSIGAPGHAVLPSFAEDVSPSPRQAGAAEGMRRRRLRIKQLS